MELNFLNSMSEGLRALEELTVQVNAAIDQINAAGKDINSSDDPFVRFSGAVFVGAGLREVQKSCRAFDAKLKKLQKERDKA